MYVPKSKTDKIIEAQTITAATNLMMTTHIKVTKAPARMPTNWWRI